MRRENVTGSLTLVVQLTVHPERSDDFERFETSAVRIMQRYGGRMERRIAVTENPDPLPDQPTEIHVVTFPSQDAFEAYRKDPELESLAGLRASAIDRTDVWSGADITPFDPESTEDS